jgi:hypothetical protein
MSKNWFQPETLEVIGYMANCKNCLFLKTLKSLHGRPQTFFQGRAKFSRGGKNIL